jgi:putative ABC transport system permease protein
MSTLKEAENEQWLSNNFFTYFKTHKKVDTKELQHKIQFFYEQKAEPELIQYVASSMEEFKAAGNQVRIILQPMADIYLTSNFSFDIGTMGSRDNVYLFLAIAIFIIGLACINFMNLSTSRRL